MTKEDLFKHFEAKWSLHFNRISLNQFVREYFGPHLAIPRSLKDDPPKSGDSVILLGNGCVMAEGYMVGKVYASYYTHWIPFPYPPQPDKDEQEFEEWWADDRGFNKPTEDYKRVARLAWMVARGRK